MTFIRTGFDKKTTTASRNAKLRDLEARLGLKQNKLEVVHTTAKPWNDLGEEGEMRLQFEDGVLVLYVKTMGHWYSTLLEREYSTQFYNLDGPQSWPAIYNRIQFDMTISASDATLNSVIAQCPVVLPPHAVIWNVACGVKSLANGRYSICIARTDQSNIPINDPIRSLAGTDYATGAGNSFADELLGAGDSDTNSTTSSSATDVEAGATDGVVNYVWFSPGNQFPIVPSATTNNYVYLLNAHTNNTDDDKTTPATLSIYIEYFGFDFRFSQDQIIAGDFSGSNPNAPIKNSVAESTSTSSGGSGV